MARMMIMTRMAVDAATDGVNIEVDDDYDDADDYNDDNSDVDGASVCAAVCR